MSYPRNDTEFHINSSLFLPDADNVRPFSGDSSFQSGDLLKSARREPRPNSAFLPSSLSFDAQALSLSLEKRERLEPPVISEERQLEDLPIKEYTVEEQKQAFAKQVAKIKYFWRGTNFNYPYAFHKFLWPNKKSALSKATPKFSDSESFDPENHEDCLILIEDYSNKMVNPAEKIFR